MTQFSLSWSEVSVALDILLVAILIYQVLVMIRGTRAAPMLGGLAAIAMMILAPFAALMLQLFLSRTREYSADETGARMVGQPYGLISALQKLGAYNQRIPTTALAPTTAALCIVKPLLGGGGLASLFSTHPPLEDRIAALRQMTIVPSR